VGGCLGAALAALSAESGRPTQAAFWPVVGAIGGVGALLLAVTWLRRLGDRTRLRTTAEHLAQAIPDGQAILTELELWSRDHPYRDDSTDANADAALIGKEGVEKTELIQKAQEWTQATRAFVVSYLPAEETTAFDHAVPVPPPMTGTAVWLHPHLTHEWTHVRGHMKWLQDRMIGFRR
jgi:hypothetical protein